jgi:iron(III) transport system substrate-binding protein
VSTLQSQRTNCQIEWEKLIAAAQAEGKIVISVGGGASTQIRPVIQAFENKYRIKATVATGSPASMSDRLLAERRAGKYEVDILFTGANSVLDRHIPAGALDPIPGELVLPEVLDQSLWYLKRHIYADPDRKYVFSYAASAEFTPIDVVFNTKILSEKIVAAWDSVWNILDAAANFKGKVVSSHPDGEQSYWSYILHPALGEKYMRRLFDRELGIVFIVERRIIVDGLATGRFAFGVDIGGAGRELDRLAKDGAPLARWSHILKKPVKEAPWLRNVGSSHNIMIVNRPPHPNARRLFLNWWLSKEGQTIRHTSSAIPGDQSLRNDLTEMGTVPPEGQRKPNVEYLVIDDPRWSSRVAADERARQLFDESRKNRK